MVIPSVVVYQCVGADSFAVAMADKAVEI